MYRPMFGIEIMDAGLAPADASGLPESSVGCGALGAHVSVAEHDELDHGAEEIGLAHRAPGQPDQQHGEGAEGLLEGALPRPQQPHVGHPLRLGQALRRGAFRRRPCRDLRCQPGLEVGARLLRRVPRRNRATSAERFAG